MGAQVKIAFNLHGDPVAHERIWGEDLGGQRYRLLNVPFHANGYAEGDIVRCEERAGYWEITGLEKDSGNATIRLLFSDSHSPQAKEVLDELVSVGCTYERGSDRLVGVTVPPTMEVSFEEMSSYLNGLSDDVLPGWEVGKWPAGVR